MEETENVTPIIPDGAIENVAEKTAEAIKNDENDFASFVPDEFKNESWVTKFKTRGEMFKSFSEAQKLLGKQGKIVPDKDAPPEVVSAFFDTLKPQDASAYALKETGDAKIDGLNNEIKSAMLEAGLHPYQANKLLSLVDPIFKRQHEEGQKAYSEEMLVADVRNTFGNRSDEVTSTVKEFFNGLEDNDRAAVKNLPNNALLALMKAIDKQASAGREHGHVHVNTNKPSSLDLQRKRDELYKEYRNVSPFEEDRRKSIMEEIYKINTSLYGKD